MARTSRQNLKSLYFHVIVQGINKEYIFLNEEKKDDISEFFKIHLNDKIIDIEDIVEYVDYREIILKYENDIGATIEKIIEDKAVGVTMLNLNVPIVSALAIPQLPVDMQEQFIEFMEQTDKLKFDNLSWLIKVRRFLYNYRCLGVCL